ncbi:hypothetical protein WJX74_011027 [Apatococcus lobatus]|uniref:LysM domain-containing protein n=1 Tax=Apatococcus lobatus TaxID=904363 RepID=A0AAW1S4D6_9CHLO
MRSSALAPGSSALWSRVHRVPSSNGTRRVARMALSVRPYTVRQGDTLSSIARKRDVQEAELVKLNHDLNVDSLREGQTILLPAGKLSGRDREILNGIGAGTYRTYPVRAGERMGDIISKRGITVAEIEALNPGINIDDLKENQVIKLPANKYTVREREMMSAIGVPSEFFKTGNNLPKFAFGALAIGVIYSIWLWRSKKEDIEDEL